jgi:hypothetical protein
MFSCMVRTSAHPRGHQLLEDELVETALHGSTKRTSRDDSTYPIKGSVCTARGITIPGT